MSADATPNLALVLVAEGQQHKEVTVNDGLNRLDAVVQLGVIDRDLAVPPASPSEGDRYLVATGGSGAWSGADGAVAAFFDGAWSVLAPGAGWVCWVADERVLLVHDGTGWHDFGASLGALQDVALLGLGTTADATNPLAAKLDNALLTAKTVGEGGSGDLRCVLNKEATANTASLVFQTAFAGHAEFGLAGDDDFHVKVSPDGSAWAEALTLDRASGAAAFPSGVLAGLVLPETKAALDAMSVTPSRRRQRLLDELVGELIYAGLWSKLDGLYVLAAHDAQAARLNLVAPASYVLNPVNAPAFVADRGYAGDGASSYLDTGFAPGSAGVGFGQDDNHLAVWSLDDLAESAALFGSTSFAINPRSTGNTYRLRDSSLTTLAPANPGTSIGHFTLSRTASSGYALYRDGALAVSEVQASAAPSTRTFWLCAWNDTSAQYSARRVAAASFGRGLSAADAAALYGALHAYLLAVGTVVS